MYRTFKTKMKDHSESSTTELKLKFRKRYNINVFGIYKDTLNADNFKCSASRGEQESHQPNFASLLVRELC